MLHKLARAVGAVLVLAAGPALADSGIVGQLAAPSADQHGWYVTGHAGVEVVNPPEFAILENLTTGGAGFEIDDSVVTVGGSARLGHVFGKQLSIWGGRVWVSAGGGYYSGGTDESAVAAPGDDIDSVQFDGTDTGVGITETAGIDYSIDFSRLDASLRAGVDLPAGEGAWITPSLSLFGGWSQLEHSVVVTERVQAPTHFFDLFESDVESMRVGAGLGLGGAIELGGGFRLTGGVEVAMTYNTAEGTAYECYDAGALTPLCDGSAGSTRLTLDDSGLGVLVQGGLGIEWNLGWANVALHGSAGYDSYQANLSFPTANGEQLSFDSDATWSYGGGLTVTVPIN